MRRALASLLFGGLACRSAAPTARESNSSAKDAGPSALAALPALPSAPTTLDIAFLPVAPSGPLGPNPAQPEGLSVYLSRGLGERTIGAPWRPTVLATDGKAHAPGSNRKRLLRFVHLADAHVADDESPSRVTGYDSAVTTHAAMRPHEGDGCRLLHAAVRTAHALHAQDPLSFVLLGGDNVDNAQENELGWVLSVLGGAPRIECDSGRDDDPVPGPDNDGKDPFASAGLGVPFLWVTGNHDVLAQGNFVVDEGQRATALGAEANGGARNYDKPGAPALSGPVVPDARRALLSRAALLERVRAHGPHGVGSGERATYAFDPPDSPVRLIVIDTAHAEGGAAGVITRRELDAHVKPLLDAALAERKIVLLAAHHPASALTVSGGIFGRPEPDAVLEAEWLALLARYPNVVASLVGHAHRHQARLLRAGPRRLWEVTTGALIDFPNQFRVIELVDEDNGWLTLHATAVDVITEGDPVGEEARRRAQVDYSAGWVPDGSGAPGQRNVILWVKKP